MDNDSPRKDEMEETQSMDSEREDALLDDPVLSQSIRSLATVEVPPAFLPNVMFQVYERHHREKVSIPWVVALSLLLIIMSVGLFIWDVIEFGRAQGLDNFQQALSRKSKDLVDNFDSLFAALSGLVSASWQLLSLFFSTTPVLLQISIFAGLLVLAFFTRKWLAGLRS